MEDKEERGLIEIEMKETSPWSLEPVRRYNVRHEALKLFNLT